MLKNSFMEKTLTVKDLFGILGNVYHIHFIELHEKTDMHHLISVIMRLQLAYLSIKMGETASITFNALWLNYRWILDHLKK